MLGEVVAQVAGSGLRVHVAILDLQRHAALEVGEQGVVERGAGLELEALGKLARGRHGVQCHHAHPVFVAAGADLVGDVADLERVRVHALLGHEGADPGHAHQHAVGGQLLQRAVGGHARNAQLAHQLVLRGHAVAGAQRAGGDLLEHEVLHLEVAGGGLRQ